MQGGLTLVMLLLISAIIITHHVTSYALFTFLVILSIAYSFLQIRTKRKQPNTWGLALVTGGLTLIWLFLVANSTTDYLSQIFKQAFASVLLLFTGEESGRALFTSSVGIIAPLWERMVGIGSVLLIFIGILSGLFVLWRRRRLAPFTIVLAMAAQLYFVALGLRFTGAGWEVANRTSEFLFVGIAYLIAFGFGALRLRYPKNHSIAFVFTGYMAILIVGGVIAGWPPDLRISKPTLVSVNGTTLQPQGLVASSWILANHGSDNQMIAPTSDALMMLAYGRQHAKTGKIYAIQELLTKKHDLKWQTEILQTVQTRFVVTDRRRVSWDGMLGPYFSPTGVTLTNEVFFFPAEIFNLFDEQAQIPRIFDSGDIVIYDVGGLSSVTQTK